VDRDSIHVHRPHRGPGSDGSFGELTARRPPRALVAVPPRSDRWPSASAPLPRRKSLGVGELPTLAHRNQPRSPWDCRSGCAGFQPDRSQVARPTPGRGRDVPHTACDERRSCTVAELDARRSPRRVAERILAMPVEVRPSSGDHRQDHVIGRRLLGRRRAVSPPRARPRPSLSDHFLARLRGTAPGDPLLRRGIRADREIRRAWRPPQRPVVLLSGEGSGRSIHHKCRAHPDGYLGVDLEVPRTRRLGSRSR